MKLTAPFQKKLNFIACYFWNIGLAQIRYTKRECLNIFKDKYDMEIPLADQELSIFTVKDDRKQHIQKLKLLFICHADLHRIKHYNS